MIHNVIQFICEMYNIFLSFNDLSSKLHSRIFAFEKKCTTRSKIDSRLKAFDFSLIHFLSMVLPEERSEDR